jgi:peroxiredoxin
MKTLLLGVALSALFAVPSFAALKVGDTAPDFTSTASLGGKDFTFHLNDALKKGPAVVYFYPSAYTGGCDLEAHTFADNHEKFDAAGATIIGVSGDTLDRLDRFSADPNYCAGKFPVASDSDLKIAKSYDLTTNAAREGMQDVNHDAVTHAIIERETFVIGKDGKIIATFSSAVDKVSPADHVAKSLAIVQGLSGKTGQ